MPEMPHNRFYYFWLSCVVGAHDISISGSCVVFSMIVSIFGEMHCDGRASGPLFSL